MKLSNSDKETPAVIYGKNSLIIAITTTILALVGLAATKGYRLKSGKEVELTITGYDPRDLLSGHYLTFRVVYDVADVCSENSSKSDLSAHICLSPRFFSWSAPDTNCKLFITGKCNYGRFVAGIERFYVPEGKAKFLEKQLRDNPASIIIKVTPDGKGQIEDLRIKGRSWKTLDVTDEP